MTVKLLLALVVTASLGPPLDMHFIKGSSRPIIGFIREAALPIGKMVAFMACPGQSLARAFRLSASATEPIG